MKLKTVARDCLYINWAVPEASIPAAPSPLRYEVHEANGENWVFVSALLFRLSGLHLESIPFARFSYPQMNLRLYVLDRDGEPSALFRRMLVPVWVAPMSRYVGRHPAMSARFRYPPAMGSPGPDNGISDAVFNDEGWEWSITRQPSSLLKSGARESGQLMVRACPGDPMLGRGPVLGSWSRTVEHFRHRRRGYAFWERRLRFVHTERPPVAALPVLVEIDDASLIAALLPGVEKNLWSTPHSAWLCAELPFIFELGPTMSLSEWSRSFVPGDLPKDLVPGDTRSGLRGTRGLLE